MVPDQIIHSVPRALDYCATDITDPVTNLMLWLSGHFLQRQVKVEMLKIQNPDTGIPQLVPFFGPQGNVLFEKPH